MLTLHFSFIAKAVYIFPVFNNCNMSQMQSRLLGPFCLAERDGTLEAIGGDNGVKAGVVRCWCATYTLVNFPLPAHCT